MNKILLKDILNIDSTNNVVKIKFNQNNGYDDPIELYKTNPDEINNQWFLWRKKRRYFNVGDLAICLVALKKDYWLLTTIKRITKELGVLEGVNYEGEELAEFKKFYGRTIIKYHKARPQCYYWNTIKDEVEINQILPTTYDGEDFPGYDKVNLTYQQLETIIKNNKKDWVNALKSQKAVYLLTDTDTGKLYVGSATSDNGMLLSRWTDYILNGHGGNEGLKELVKEKGFEHIKKYFTYSIIENYNAKVDDSIILEREYWWMNVLKSRSCGYNRNGSK